MKTLISSIVLGTVGATLALSQPASQLPDCKTRLDQVRSATSSSQKDIRIDAALRVEQNSSCYAQLLLQRLATNNQAQIQAFAKLVQAVEARRNDKQAGSSQGTGGTTSIVSKGLAAEAISVAAEYGAVTQSVNNQIITVQGSLGGFAAALARQRLIEYCPAGGAGTQTCLSRGGLNFLKRISYGVSFDTSQNAQSVSGTPSGPPEGSAQPVTFTANRHQISAWTGRAVLWNLRDVSSDTFKAKWLSTLQTAAGTQTPAGASADAVRQAAGDLLKSFQSFLDSVPAPSGTDFAAAFQSMQSANATQLDALFDQWADKYVNRIQSSPTILANAVELMQNRSAYLLAEDEVVSSLADQPVLSLEYNNNRPVGQEPTSTFRLIFDKGLGRFWSFTANGAFTFYDTPPKVAQVSRLRDAQLGLQIQRDIGKVFSMPAAVAVSYYFQYQNAPAILNVTPGNPLPGITFVGLPDTATQVFAKTGNIHVGQFRVVLTPGKSSVRFPLAVSYSNRTDLIAKPFWRAQLGVSYDFDSLFSK